MRLRKVSGRLFKGCHIAVALFARASSASIPGAAGGQQPPPDSLLRTSATSSLNGASGMECTVIRPRCFLRFQRSKLLAVCPWRKIGFLGEEH